MWYIHDGHNLHTLLNGILRAANQELIGSCNLSFIYHDRNTISSPLSLHFILFFFQNRAITVIRRRKIGISHLYTGCLVIEGLMPGFIRVVSRFQSFFYNCAYIYLNDCGFERWLINFLFYNYRIFLLFLR